MVNVENKIYKMLSQPINNICDLFHESMLSFRSDMK